MGIKRSLAMGLCFLFFSCAGQSTPQTINLESVNPNATLAFFSLNNLNDETRLEYAAALQKAGLYNFIASEPSEEQIDSAVEIRLLYKEQGWKINRIPILVLEAEFLKGGKTWFKSTIKEESDVSTYMPWTRSKEKKFRRQVLLERFIKEAIRVKSWEPSGTNA
ncbi:MAG: hypothetical protein LBC64_00890 [Fibromonadaceae bacterium]|jgi:hypothetical protein|nr:hypothetical protein [Fibromonadaceae bacterium]